MIINDLFKFAILGTPNGLLVWRIWYSDPAHFYIHEDERYALAAKYSDIYLQLFLKYRVPVKIVCVAVPRSDDCWRIPQEDNPSARENLLGVVLDALKVEASLASPVYLNI